MQERNRVSAHHPARVRIIIDISLAGLISTISVTGLVLSVLILFTVGVV